MSKQIFSYSPPFSKLRPVQRLLRLVRVAGGTVLVFFLACVTVACFGFLGSAPNPAALFAMLGSGLFVGVLAILGIRILVWRPSGKVPSLEMLKSVVGSSETSEEFKKLLNAYRFRKIDGFWISSFGIWLSSRDDRIHVTIHTPSRSWLRDCYYGNLPGGLEGDDSIGRIVEKLGTPLGTFGDPEQFYGMGYDGMTIIARQRRLSEIWLS